MSEIRNLTRNGETFYPLTTSSAVINESTGEGLIIDDEPTMGSENLVKSGGVFESTLHKSIVGELSDNMITNEVTWTDGYYAKTNSKSDVAASSISKTSKIPVVVGRTYVFPAYAGSNFATGMFCRVSNAAGNYVTESSTPPYFTNISISSDNIITLTIPTGGVAIEINFKTTDKASCFLKELYTSDTKQPINWLEVNKQNLDAELNDAIFNIKGTQVNGDYVIFDSEDITFSSFTENGYMSQSGYEISETSSQTAHSAIIPVTQGERYKVYNGQEVNTGNYRNYFIFANDQSAGAIASSEIINYVTHILEDGKHVYYVTIPEDCTTFYITIADNKRDQAFVKRVVLQKVLNWLQVTSDNLDDDLTEHLKDKDKGYYLQDSIKRPIVFAGKKMLACGDSITHGTCSPNNGDAGENAYIRKFMSYAGVSSSSQEKAVGGSCIADTTSYDEVNNIVKRVKEFADSATDIIWIAGGGNDWIWGRPLGDFNSTDTATFYGALNNVCTWIKENCPNATVIFVTPIPFTKPASMYPYHIAELDAYRTAIYQVATAYEFNVVSGSTLGLPRVPGGWNNFMCADSDGCHPTVEGHKLMARNLCGKLL